MSLIVTDPDKNFPPGYRRFTSSGIPFGFFHFAGTIGLLHVFAARYRFAREFQLARFETFGSTTAAGYSALCKLLFTYAAFEALRRLLGIGDDLRALDLTRHPLAEWDAALRAAPTHDRLFHCLTWRPYLKSAALRAQCAEFRARRPYNVLLLATAVRNSFAHGHLTPGANRTEPDCTRHICGVLTGALFAIMDAEFSTPVNEKIDDAQRRLREAQSDFD